jgi:hypothetical protein
VPPVALAQNQAPITKEIRICLPREISAESPSGIVY